MITLIMKLHALKKLAFLHSKTYMTNVVITSIRKQLLCFMITNIMLFLHLNGQNEAKYKCPYTTSQSQKNVNGQNTEYTQSLQRPKNVLIMLSWSNINSSNNSSSKYYLSLTDAYYHLFIFYFIKLHFSIFLERGKVFSY